METDCWYVPTAWNDLESQSITSRRHATGQAQVAQTHVRFSSPCLESGELDGQGILVDPRCMIRCLLSEGPLHRPYARVTAFPGLPPIKSMAPKSIASDADYRMGHDWSILCESRFHASESHSSRRPLETSSVGLYRILCHLHVHFDDWFRVVTIHHLVESQRTYSATSNGYETIMSIPCEELKLRSVGYTGYSS